MCTGVHWRSAQTFEWHRALHTIHGGDRVQRVSPLPWCPNSTWARWVHLYLLPWQHLKSTCYVPAQPWCPLKIVIESKPLWHSPFVVVNSMFFYSMVLLKQWYRWTVGTYEGSSLTWYNHCLWRHSPVILHCAVVCPYNITLIRTWINVQYCLVTTINRVN